MTNVFEYNKINRLTFSHNVSEILSLLAKTAYLGNSPHIFTAKKFTLDLKAKKVKNGLKLNALFTIFVQFLVSIAFFSNYLPFN